MIEADKEAAETAMDIEGTKDADREAVEEAEANKLASELPDVPKSGPDGHADKKQKTDS